MTQQVSASYPAPNTPESPVQYKEKYDNFIGGEWVPPVNGEYFENPSPVNGRVFTKVARSQKEDIELALDKAHQAKEKWGNTSVAERSRILLKIADRLEENLEKLALSETWDNGKPIRETLAADLPLAIDHFRYFAGVIRGEEGSVSEIDAQTLSMHIKEPIGVVGQIIPWNFPLLMAAWKLAPALAAGNCVVLKPAEQTPATIMLFAELVGDLLPPGVLNIVNGFGPEAGQPLATSPRVGKVAFTGETTTGRLIMQFASENITPVTLELGGKSPNIFTESVMRKDDAFLEKALEGFTLFALNQGEVCTCPSRALIQESIYDEFIERALERVRKIKMGDPLHPETMMGAQASKDQYEKILSYIDIGKKEGAEVLTGGAPVQGVSPEQVHEFAPYGIIAVAMGGGIADIFLRHEADIVLSGGQTMNPSTEDFLQAIESLSAEQIYLLPNNGNVILTAQQAAEMSGRSVTVIPTRSIPQG
ncbi:aldehyde dehydrogenase family protein, partial [Caldibacillus debilis]|uniref:aldehyde dehydrogenase family protein n=1 Tax=Caldibacillus debilis TaxID=301148 RepID=UPI0023EFDC6A